MQKKSPLVNYLSNRNIKCYLHNEPVSFLDLSKVCQDRSRLKCEYCKQNQYCVTIQQFNNLCEQFSKITKNDNDQIMKAYQEIYQSIQTTINQMNDQIQKTIFKPKYDKNLIKYLESYIQIIYSYNYKYAAYNSIKDIGLQEFEFLTQGISEEVDFQGLDNQITMKIQAIDDQKQAESNQYLDLVMQLNQMISNFVVQNKLSNSQIQNNIQKIEEIDQAKLIKNSDIQIFNQEGQILGSSSKLPIADIQLNFDQTILAARLCEPCKEILFWKKDSIQNTWIKYQICECYTKSLVYFTFSKLQNILLTSGSDQNKRNMAILKIWVLKEDSWIINQTYVTQVQPGLGYQRISCIVMNPTENHIYLAEGTRIVALQQQNLNYELKYCIEKSSELITTLGISNDGKILAVGGCDQKVTLWKIDDAKLVLFQQLKLYNTPKSIIFGAYDQDLIICTKDGLVHCFNNQYQKQKEYYEIQKIFNNIAKIRTIKFNHKLSILAIGGETNVLQLWKKDQQNQWKCFNEYKQDKFIESICFAKGQEFIFATNNYEIYLHQLF
ncbi:unnamed protein product [Paramecium primaurelia]|uniref:WD40-repeat-containing domain n=1 Tax=Paramecium primaurelia TaxID=5886 RepID=A0A8S1K066_PARPR|nr:unnamed protein product [Paramecium primaurelia]